MKIRTPKNELLLDTTGHWVGITVTSWKGKCPSERPDGKLLKHDPQGDSVVFELLFPEKDLFESNFYVHDDH